MNKQEKHVYYMKNIHYSRTHSNTMLYKNFFSAKNNLFMPFKLEPSLIFKNLPSISHLLDLLSLLSCRNDIDETIA